MSDGVLQCCGTPLFLKNNYGVGYHLTIVKSNHLTDENLITTVVKEQIHNARLENKNGTQISYRLPNDECLKFGNLFALLDNNKQLLEINGYGVSCTSMDEVFIRFALSD